MCRSCANSYSNSTLAGEEDKDSSEVGTSEVVREAAGGGGVPGSEVPSLRGVRGEPLASLAAVLSSPVEAAPAAGAGRLVEDDLDEHLLDSALVLELALLKPRRARRAPLAGVRAAHRGDCGGPAGAWGGG